MYPFTAIVLGFLLWNWPVSSFLDSRAMFNGVSLGLFVCIFIIWVHSIVQTIRGR